jgi:TonB family protein
MRSLAVTIALITAAAIASPLVAQRQECGETTNPKTLPPAHEMIDSADAITELKAFNRLPDEMLFSLVFADDSFPLVAPLVGADVQAAMVLLRSVWPQKPSGTWAVRVHVVGGASPALAVERSIYCPPSPEQSGVFPKRILAEVRQGDHKPPPGLGRVHIRLDAEIDETGNVLSVSVTHSTGITDLDNQIVQDWQKRRFKPALIDGRPIRALYRTDRESPRL